jgi:uncharacterized protein YndB with AHSA1/START domain
MRMEAIERTVELAASPERVWTALTDPRELERWFPDAVTDLEARAGGSGWLRWARYGRYAVRFEVFDPPRRLAWSWSRDPDVAVGEGTTTRVEWRLEARADGGTTLFLRESGFQEAKHREENVSGWAQELAELRAHLAATGSAGSAGSGGTTEATETDAVVDAAAPGTGAFR